MDNYQLISQQLACYFEGLYQADVSLLEQVFHRNARYTCTTGGELIHLSMTQYFENVAQREAPAMLGHVRQDRILAIDIIGKHTALAKVQCVLFPKFFTDFLSFVFIDGRWQIISKVFHYQLNAFD